MSPRPVSILVVDDNQGLARLIQKGLEREAFSAVVQHSGNAAIAWLRQNPVDLMLLDLKLPDIGGKELVDHLASLGRTVPFIIITGQGDERVAVEMMKRGALDYVVKDTQFIELVPGVVQRALTRMATERKLTETEAALGKSEALKQAVMHSLEAHLAVLDSAGNIIAVNNAWNRFTHDAEAGGVSRGGVGANYPSLLRRAQERGSRDAAQALAGIQSVLAGERAQFAMEYATHAPGADGWFVMQVTRAGGPGSGVVVSHADSSERKRLERSLLDVREREQRKFGEELHDGLGQRLTGLEMLSNVLAEELAVQAPGLVAPARRLNRELRETITQARLISHSLAPVPLEGEGLMRALGELAASTAGIPGVQCRFACEPPVSITDAATANHLYRIAQEAVNNALKHGHASRIQISLQQRGAGLELAVENNGSPMLPAPQPSTGMGLNVMRYRAGMIGGSLAIEPGKRKGLRVVCTL